VLMLFPVILRVRKDSANADLGSQILQVCDHKVILGAVGLPCYVCEVCTETDDFSESNFLLVRQKSVVSLDLKLLINGQVGTHKIF